MACIGPGWICALLVTLLKHTCKTALLKSRKHYGDSLNELTHSVDAASFLFKSAFDVPYSYQDRDGEKCMSLDAKAGLTIMDTLQKHSILQIFHDDVRNHMQELAAP